MAEKVATAAAGQTLNGKKCRQVFKQQAFPRTPFSLESAVCSEDGILSTVNLPEVTQSVSLTRFQIQSNR